MDEKTCYQWVHETGAVDDRLRKLTSGPPCWCRNWLATVSSSELTVFFFSLCCRKEENRSDSQTVPSHKYKKTIAHDSYRQLLSVSEEVLITIIMKSYYYYYFNGLGLIMRFYHFIVMISFLPTAKIFHMAFMCFYQELFSTNPIWRKAPRVAPS